jgi:hypothetical protein
VHAKSELKIGINLYICLQPKVWLVARKKGSMNNNEITIISLFISICVSLTNYIMMRYLIRPEQIRINSDQTYRLMTLLEFALKYKRYHTISPLALDEIKCRASQIFAGELIKQPTSCEEELLANYRRAELEENAIAVLLNERVFCVFELSGTLERAIEVD